MDLWQATYLPKVIWNKIHRSKDSVDLLKLKKNSKNIHKKVVINTITISTWKLKSSRTLLVKWRTTLTFRSFTMSKEIITTQMLSLLTKQILLSNNNLKTVSSREDLCTMKILTTKPHHHPRTIKHNLLTKINNYSNAMAKWMSTLSQLRKNYHHHRPLHFITISSFLTRQQRSRMARASIHWKETNQRDCSTGVQFMVRASLRCKIVNRIITTHNTCILVRANGPGIIHFAKAMLL